MDALERRLDRTAGSDRVGTVGRRPRRAAGLPRLLHVVLLVWWTAVLLALPVVGERGTSVAGLLSAVEAGRVEVVEVTGGLAEDSTGWATQTARWRDGLGTSVTQQVLVRGTSVDDVGADGQVSTVDLADRVRAADPGVEVRRLPQPTGGAGVLGYGLDVVPGAAAVPLLDPAVFVVGGWPAAGVAVAWFGHMLLVGNGPPPRRGTRWGWFWLLLLPPVGPLLQLLVGSWAGREPRPGAPARFRLNGWWGLLVLVLVATTVSPPV
ncbi:hypothetical protein [Aquipuribacter sp. SD81]|uniref:hypothetical protein n=1 Tax=Aquipuribacter sp. SD81 TaxID=3127703 RepID=UPI0030184DE2